MTERNLYLPLLFLLLSMSMLMAQPINCINLGELEEQFYELNTSSPPAQVIFSDDLANINISTSFYSIEHEEVMSSGSFLVHAVVPSEFHPGMHLQSNYINAQINYPQAQSNVCFYININNLEVNFGINGQVHSFTNILSPDIPGTFADHNFSITPINDFYAQICIENDIQNFTIGGLECFFGNICSSPGASNCFDNDFEIYTHCTGTNQYDLVIDFEPVGVQNDYFDLFINDEFYDFYPFAELPINISSSNIDVSGDVMEVRIQENDNPDCYHEEYVQVLECPCTLDNINFYQQNCIGEPDTYGFILDFDAYNYSGQDSFTLVLNDGVEQWYSYNTLPLALQIEANAGDTVFYLIETYSSLGQNASCAEDGMFEVVSCQEVCNDFTAELITDYFSCEEPGFALVFFNVDYAENEDHYSLTDISGGMTYPITYYGVNDIAFHIPIEEAQEIILINNYTGCQETFSNEPFLICATCIDNITIDLLDCDPLVDEYSVTVDFSTELPDENFHVDIYNTELDFYAHYGPMSYDNFPFDISGLPVNQSEATIINIRDDSDHCQAQGSVYQNCSTQDCNFTNVHAEAHPCDGDQFLVDIEFDNPNGGEQGFYIFGNGMINGPFEYGQTFYTFGPLSGAQANHNIMLLDIANPACFANYSLNNSCSDDCQIQSVEAIPLDCEDNQFFVELNVTAANTGDFFSVVGNGNNYGDFTYADLPITLGPFEGDGVTELEFAVIDLQNAACSNWTSFVSPNCNPCSISNLDYTVDCTDGELALTIDFDYENTDSDIFYLYFDGELYEGFLYSSLPLTLDGIEYEQLNELITVQDAENPECSQSLPFENPCCSLGNLFDELVLIPCNDDGTYSLIINNADGFNLSDSLVISYAPAGSSIIATEVVAYADLPYSVDGLIGNGATDYQFFFTDQENICVQFHSQQAIFCDNTDCVEFESTQGIYGPLSGYDDNSLILEENEVAITYQELAIDPCNNCNVYILEEIPGVNFGNGHILSTQHNGIGLDFGNVSAPFNTVNIDFYHPAAAVGLSINGAPFVSANSFEELISLLPSSDIEIQLSMDPATLTGVLTFIGDIEQIELYGFESLAIDNICLSSSDNVWPGDTNTDNIANHFDLLNIGIAYQSTGPTRASVADDWDAFMGSNWADNFANGTNFKHADANGDGVVDLLDREVLIQNYGLAHGNIQAYEPLPYTNTDPTIYALTPTELPNAATFEIPVIAGEEGLSIEDIYGLAFTLELDPNVIDLNSITIEYPVSWFGEPGVNTITVDKINEDGTIEVALSRTDQNPVSGYGTIMYIRGIIDDIAALTHSTEINVAKVYAINYEQEPMPLRPQTSKIIVTDTDDGIDRQALKNSIDIYPNPASSSIWLKNDYNLDASQINIYTQQAQLVLHIDKPAKRIDISDLAAGLYIVEIHVEGFIVSKKLVLLD